MNSLTLVNMLHRLSGGAHTTSEEPSMALEQFRLDEQVAIVTGAGQGCGGGHRPAEAGATVVGTARTEADIVGTIEGIEAAGGKGLALVADAMSRPDGARVREYGHAALRPYRHSGQQCRRVHLRAISRHHRRRIRHTFDWRVTSAFLMSQLTAPHMLSAGHGSNHQYLIELGAVRHPGADRLLHCEGRPRSAHPRHGTRTRPEDRVNAVALGSFATHGLKGSLDFRSLSTRTLTELASSP